ncbi:hypothetical protein DEO72_LG11g1280 [Vigna unguiculata]|uniref:Uncharacterized protein n=1 Tax=Vigna unguiculata TaxID=3917 RepID=A0A4D6NMX4_VIGUN|nr:hypothetical protein DEO72_LG11g1280 [Vigna unguiculata]
MEKYEVRIFAFLLRLKDALVSCMNMLYLIIICLFVPCVDALDMQLLEIKHLRISQQGLGFMSLIGLLTLLMLALLFTPWEDIRETKIVLVSYRWLSKMLLALSKM